MRGMIEREYAGGNMISWSLGLIIAIVILILFILLVILGRVEPLVGFGIAGLALAIITR